MSPHRPLALRPAILAVLLVLFGVFGVAPVASAEARHPTRTAKAPAKKLAAPAEEHHDEAVAAPAEPAEAHAEAPAEAHHDAAPAESHDEHAAAVEHHDDPHAGPPPGLTEEEKAEYDPELDVDMTKAPPSTNPKAYGDFLRLALQKVRPKVLEKLETKMIVSQEKTMNRFSAGLFFFSLLGGLLVLRPLFLLKKYPGKEKALFGYGLLSSGLFFVAVNLFAAVLGLLRFAQGAAGRITNPQVAIVEAAFDVLEKNADDLATLGPKLIEPSMHRLAAGDADFVVVLLENLKSIKGDVSVILAIAKAMKGLGGVLAWLPVLLTVVAVVTFAMSAKQTLLAIVKLPETAASGGGAKDVVMLVLRRVKGELLATLCLVGMLILVTIFAGMALRAAVEPAIESLLSTIFLAAMYIQLEKVSSLVLFGSLALAALVLVLNMGVVMAASTAVLGKMHKIFQRKFHEGLPLSAHGRFWKRAPLAVLVCFLFPIVYDTVAEKGVERILEHTLEAKDPSYAAALVGAPAALVIGFLVCFGAVLGVHALLFLFKYPVAKIAMPVSPFDALMAEEPVILPPLSAAPVAPMPLAPVLPPVERVITAPAPMPLPEPTVDDLAVFDSLKGGRPKVVPVAPLVTQPTRISTPASTRIPTPSAAVRTVLRSSRAPLPLQIPADSIPEPPVSESDLAKTNVFHRGSTRIPSVDATIQMPTFVDTLEQKRVNDDTARRA